MHIAIVGAGRAGLSFAIALRDVGYDVTVVHHDEPLHFPTADVVLLCVPDDAISDTAVRVTPHDQVVAHVSGSVSLDALAPHARVGSLHPLMVLPSGEVGAARLRGVTMCVSGDAVLADIAHALEARIITVDEHQRTLYHATASVAANHLVVLMGQVSRLAEAAGLALEDFLPLAQQALADVQSVGPAAALTGPASRGDLGTIDAHLNALAPEERATYVALANAALEMGERRAAAVRA
jgi:predicted short-subunit dehydrogenase-like oxidoreductase (DUF2520 family)